MNTDKFYKPVFFPVVAGAAVLLGAGAPAVHAQANLVVNGDFSAGATGFSTDYTLATAAMSTTGQYILTTNPNSSFPGEGFASYGDHTTGSGNMLFLDGAPSSSSRAWYETITLLANTNYTYSYWAASAYTTNPAILTFSAASNQVGSAFSLTTTAGAWQQTSGTFNSGAGGTVVVAIRDTNTIAAGNDFTLDDIRITATAPEPGTFSLALVGIVPFGSALFAMRRKSQCKRIS